MVKRVFILFFALCILAAPVFALDYDVTENSVSSIGLGFNGQFPVFSDGTFEGRLFEYEGFQEVSLVQYYVPITFPCQRVDTVFTWTIEPGVSYTSSITVDLVDISSTYGIRVLEEGVSRSYSWIGSTSPGRFRLVSSRVLINTSSFTDAYTANATFLRVNVSLPNNNRFFFGSQTNSGSFSGSTSSSGTWKVNSVPSSSYMPESSAVTSDNYALFLQREINGVNYFFLNRGSSGTNSTLSSNPFTNLFQGTSSDSGTQSGTIELNNYSTSRVAYISAQRYSSNENLINAVDYQTEIISGQMQQILDDMQAKQDTANDIGSVTTQDQISGTQETMSSGVSGINSGLDLVQSMDTFSADAFGYVTLLTRSLPVITGIGNGVISWAFVFPFVLSALIFIFKRLR